jgi:hypothetical protein
MWIHAETNVGKDGSSSTIEWFQVKDKKGVPRLATIGSHGDDFANHYVWVKPDKATLRITGGLRAGQMLMRAFTDPDPVIQWQGYEGGALPLVRDGDRLLAVFDDGHREDATFLASDTMLAKLFDPDLLWVSPAEASPFAGASTRPHFVGLSRDGTQFLSSAVRLEGRYEESFSVPEECTPGVGQECVAPSSRALPRAGSKRAPNARQDFVAVYSRVNGRVFVVGGRDAANGTALDEVWTYRFEDDAWDRLSLHGWLGDGVLASTFSWRDECLWILALDPADATRRTTRLLRLEPATGTIRVVASAKAAKSTPKYEHRGLFLDLDGNIGVFASSERSQKHRVAILSRRPAGYDVAITKRRDRHLSAEPIVDLRGVALFYEPDRPPVDPSRDPDDDPEPGDRIRPASRLRKLPVHPSTMAQLEDLLR